MRKASGSNSRRLVLWLFILGVICGAAAYELTVSARPSGSLEELDVRYVVVDLRGGGYRVAPALASEPDGSEGFSSMIERLRPFAAITGTYYDSDRLPLGDIVIDGEVVRRGNQRQGVGFTAAGRIVFRERKGSSRIDWRGCSSGIACGPRLLRAGEKDIDVRRDGFQPAAVRKVARRAAVGATPDGKLILCVVLDMVTLDQLAGVMLELGASDAINMDGGTSCALYENGEYRVEPAVSMSSILAVYKRK